MPRALKVYRTAVGFRDAYVAVPSKAAALRAWGTQKDLFARGAAEQVTDPALIGDVLNTPGKVVYRTRGGLEEQVAALGPLPARKKKSDKADTPTTTPRKPARPTPRPRPSRAELDAVEAAVAGLTTEQQQADAELRERENALAAERKAMEKRFAERLRHLEQSHRQACAAYQAALRDWEP